MKIYELIQALEDYPQNTEVIIMDRFDGRTAPIRSISIIKDDGKFYPQNKKVIAIQF